MAPLTKYREKVPAQHRSGVDRAMRCVRCDCGGRLCLNRNMRIINFAHECEVEAHRTGSPIVARLARALFDVVRSAREWDEQHFRVIEALCFTLEDIGETGTPPSLYGESFEAEMDCVEEWVGWLEKWSRDLASEPSDFACLRQHTPAAKCPSAAACGH